MPTSAFRGRRVLAIARQQLAGPDSPARWLVALRWIAIAGMAATIGMGSWLVPALPSQPLWVVLGLLTVVNFYWAVKVHSQLSSPTRSIGPQIMVDVLALSAILWCSGGVSNPFSTFLIFHIVLAGLLGSRKIALSVTLLAVSASALLAFAPQLENIPEAALYYGRVVALVALGTFTGVFVLIIAQRLASLRDKGARSERLESLGRQAAAISHELNNPLGTILLASKELVEVGKEEGLEEVVYLAGTMADEARRASDVIGLMRGYVRPDVEAESVDLGQLIEEWSQRELDRAGYQGERVLDLPTGIHVTVLGVALRQILSNVLMNAVDALKYSPKPRLEIRLERRPQGPLLIIQDNGAGLSPAIAPLLGEPFRTTKENQGGMGLGLYVSTRLAEHMEATLSLENAPVKGTRVLLQLPNSP